MVPASAKLEYLPVISGGQKVKNESTWLTEKVFVHPKEWKMIYRNLTGMTIRLDMIGIYWVNRGG